MVDLDNETLYIFVVDTTEYAGNFYRQLTAHCTGQVGERDVVGHELADILWLLHPNRAARFEAIMEQVPDEHGCHRPCTLIRSPSSGEYNSVAMFFAEVPTPDDIAFLKQRAAYYPTDEFEITGYRFLRRDITI